MTLDAAVSQVNSSRKPSVLYFSIIVNIFKILKQGNCRYNE